MNRIYLKYKQLSSAANIDEYRLHLAAWEWSVEDPIIIRNESDIQAQKWRERGLKPFKHQFQNLIYFFRKMPCALIADDVGLGKTISAALILSELLARNKIKRALIIAPKILCSQWQTELWNLFGLKSEVAESGAKFENLISKGDFSILIATYDVLRGKIEAVKKDFFGMGIFDEAHKLRNLYGTKEPPKIAKVIKKAFSEQLFRYVLMLTATPVQNRIWDIYSLIDLMKLIEGEDNPLGDENFFEQNFLADGRGITLLEEQQDYFRQILQKSICRTRRKDSHLPFPERRIQDVPFELQFQEERLHDTLQDLIVEANVDYFLSISLVQALMSSPQAFLAQYRNSLEKKPILQKWLPEIEELVSQIPVSQKMRKILQLLEGLRAEAEKVSRPWRAIIFTLRKESQKQIGKCLEENGFRYDFIQGASPITNRKTIEKYKADPPKINVIVSTDAGAEGVNLQEGNVVINYDLPWNPMRVEQRIGRVQRLGSTFENVLVFNPYAQGTIEEFIVERLLLKLIGISQAIGDLEGILDIYDEKNKINYGKEYKSFEDQINKLVYSALKKQDFEINRLEIENAVQEATQYYEEHKSEIDETISETNWAEELAEENLPPEIEPQHHSMTAQEFLTKAWEIDQPLYNYGGKPFRISDEIWNRPEELQNSREFKDCTGDWRKRASSFVYDLHYNLSQINEAVKTAWFQNFPESQVERIVRSGQVNSDFQGQILFRAEVSNAVNRFQKVLSSPVVTLGDSIPDYSLGEADIPEDFAIKRNYNAEIARMLPDPSALAQQTVESDEGLQRFARYYYNVLDAKQSATEKMDVRRRNAENFTPNFSAEMCGIQGFTYEIFPLTVHFLADSHPYSISARWIPIIHSFQPIETGCCEVTGIVCPDEILEECQLTNKKVLSHLLVTIHDDFRVLESETAVCGICHERDLKSTMEISPINHLWEHISHKVECSFSHKMGFPEEMETSDFSGRIAFAKFIRTSEKSGRKGIIDEFVQCTRTKAVLLQDEVQQRTADGFWYDVDLFRKSAVSQRWELAELMGVCEYSRDWVLSGELAFCCVSRQYVRRDLTSESPFSHRFFRKDLGIATKDGILLPPDEVCPICELPLLRNEEKIHHPDYERMVHADHFVQSVVTGHLLFKEEAKRSDYSGKFAEPEYFLISDCSQRCGLENEIFQSEKSKRIGLLDEGKICARTGKNLLVDECHQSIVDGQWYDTELMQKSAISDRYELPENLVSCESTGVRVLPDELVPCCISGKKIRQDFILQSPISNRFFNRNLGIQTADSQILPPDEVCTICNRGIQQNEQWYKNTNTGRKVHRSHFVMSSITKKIILKTDARCSDYSKKYAEKNFFQTSTSGRIGLPDEFCTCAKTNEHLLKDEARFSNRSHCWYKKEFCGLSDISKDYGLTEDLIVCEHSQQKMFPEESGICVVSGLRVAKKFLITSSVSGLTFLPKFRVISTENQPLMKSEADFCRWQCGYIPQNETGKCSLCGLTFSKKFLVEGEFKQFHDLRCAISTNLKFRWPIIDTKLCNLLYKLPQYQPDFNITSPSCVTRILMNNNQRAFVFCTQTFIKKFLFFGTYVYYFGLVHIQSNKLVLLHKPLRQESSCNIWDD